MFSELTGKSIVLDNNLEYQVIWIREINGKEYICLLEKNNFSNMMIGEKSGETITEIKDKQVLTSIINNMSRDINIMIL